MILYTHFKYSALIFSVLAMLLTASCSNSVNDNDDEVLIKNLPQIDPFMYKPDSVNYAVWLDRKQSDGRFIREPINIIIVDSRAKDSLEAIARLLTAFTLADFPPRFGHTGGYFGKMDGKLNHQQPSVSQHAFSDYMWAFTNNHARIFGPYKVENAYYWIGSSSRERGISHDYVSFDRARNDLANMLVSKANAVVISQISLNNKLDDSEFSTGDHDGKATMIKLN